MSGLIRVTVNGVAVEVAEGTTIAAAVSIARLPAGMSALRTSVTGEPRGALCGMGICFECRVTVNGKAHTTSCQMLCQDGMRVETT